MQILAKDKLGKCCDMGIFLRVRTSQLLGLSWFELPKSFFFLKGKLYVRLFLSQFPESEAKFSHSVLMTPTVFCLLCLVFAFWHLHCRSNKKAPFQEECIIWECRGWGVSAELKPPLMKGGAPQNPILPPGCISSKDDAEMQVRQEH